MNSDKNEAPKLPDGWILCTSKSNPGRKYYFNRKTGKSSWTEPQADNTTGDKRKSKKEKANVREKKKKEDTVKKNLKRRSDGTSEHSSSFPKKRPKEETQSSKKHSNSKKVSSTKCPDSTNKQSKSMQKGTSKTESINNRESLTNRESISSRESLTKGESLGNRESLGNTEDVNQRDSTGKRESVSSIESPIKRTPSKNIANSRLSQLRAQLNADVQKEETKERSPIKSKQKSPVQTETSAKIVKTDKSPNLNELKTTQSPSNDSLPSIPSPSQFFVANKIISSMKAQLPEEYCNKSKQKDTFADIEQGICNQTTEYPFMKHPATPPQFSEASKLVSAIKSKLTYKVPCKENNVENFSSAKDRMEALRTRLSSEAMDTAINDDFDGSRVAYSNEAMDVDCKEMKPSFPLTNCIKDNVRSNRENVVLVVDTNIFIHELDFIKNVLNSHIKGYSEQPTLLVPWRVINELDRLKDNNNGNGAICKRAKSAMDYLYKSLPENSRIKGQSLRDANSHIYPCELPDDEILNCCLQQQERGKSVILLSNDKNLCNKACINDVKCIGLAELKGLLESKPLSNLDPELIADLKHSETTVYQLLANILENEMRAKYNNLWQHVVFKAPPWTLADVLQCLLKHWIAVFSEVFPRIEHLITDLRNSLVAVENKDPKTLSQSEASNFKELCLEIAKKCQIIPEYMELAKTTVDRLVRRCESEGDGDMVVIDAFEGVWTVFSSYCAKLSTGLGLDHSVEDKLPGNDTLDGLTTKLPLFSNNITALTVAIKGVLSVDPADPSLDDQTSRLERAFKDSLDSVCKDTSVVNRNNLRIFCIKCRNMLQEAYTKFTQLSDLLEVCKNSIVTN